MASSMATTHRYVIASGSESEATMYLVIDIDRNFLLLATRDMLAAWERADKSEAKGVATIVRFEAGFRQ